MDEWIALAALLAGVALWLCADTLQEWRVRSTENDCIMAFGDPEGQMSKVYDAITTITNPISGAGAGGSLSKLLKHLFEHELGTKKVKTFVTRSHGDAREHIRNFPSYALGSGAIGCVVIGGDGTFNEVLNGVLERPDANNFLKKTIFSVLPMGSGNGIAMSIVGKSVSEAVRAISTAAPLPATGNIGISCDVLRTAAYFRNSNDPVVRHAALAVYWGAVADYCELTELRLRGLGKTAKELLAPPILVAKGHFSHEGTVHYINEYGHSGCIKGPFFSVIASNLPYIAHDVPIAPKARHDDGLIHLVLFKGCGRVQGVKYFLASGTGQHLDLEGVTILRCKYVRIEPAFGTTARMAVDGEIVPTSRIEIEVKPSLMRMYGPPPFEWKLADLR